MKKILFWPGLGKPKNVLTTFIEKLSKNYEIITFPFFYDQGKMPFSYTSDWTKWLCTHHFDCWCGISLGASLAHKMAGVCGTDAPEYLILINPFHNRQQLSKEMNFSMDGQWNFSLSENIGSVKELDMVVSLHDNKIPLHHSVEIMSETIVDSKYLFFVDDDHCISNSDIQIELADLFYNYYEKKQFQTYKHCHIYQQI